MSDIVSRLRRWAHDVNAVPASDIMDEAAADIERLRISERHWRESYKTLFIQHDDRERLARKCDALEREIARLRARSP